MRRRNTGFARRALSMTPLIDIIFLLLLFFMLTSTFTKFAEVPLITAGKTRTEPATPKNPVFLRVAADGLSVNGDPTDFADITQAIRNAKTDLPETLVLLSIEETVPAQLFVDALTRSRAVPDVSVVVLR
ncbi:biopolymer transporter ExbD [Halocynthiibacter sp.]|uniref:biopolymer transporter ExbD n=1 Tax=Halocynthiibacter sp. TaxID=1979210 RepID=UPI003C5F65B0